MDEKLIQKGNYQFIEVNCKLIGISQNFVKIKWNYNKINERIIFEKKININFI